MGDDFDYNEVGVENEDVVENDGSNYGSVVKSVSYDGSILIEKDTTINEIEFKIGMTFSSRFSMKKAIKYYEIINDR